MDAEEHTRAMFAVDDSIAEAIRRALHESGELAAVVELRRHFPLFRDNAQARVCVRAIASWKPLPTPKVLSGRAKPGRTR
jgi:hypothetical protein